MCINGGNIITFEHPSFAPSPADLQRTLRTIAPRQHLFFEGDPRTHLFVVESGWAKLYRTLIDGQRQVVGFCNGGSILGLEGSAGYVNGCEAVTQLKVRAIPIAKLSEICGRDPDFADQLIRQIGRQLATAQTQLTTIGAQSAQQKLATFLLAFAEYNGSDEFDLPVRRIDIAEFLGLRLETVSRKMTEMQQMKWIRMLSMYRCRILRHDLLQYLADGGDPNEFAAVGYHEPAGQSRANRSARPVLQNSLS
jgi:CRP/FNR family transcriptional regulator